MFLSCYPTCERLLLFSCAWHTWQGPFFWTCTTVGAGAAKSDDDDEGERAGTRGDDGRSGGEDVKGELAAFMSAEGLCHKG